MATSSPSHYVCHKAFSDEHCLSCPNGGYTIFRHNELRDVTAQLLAETCHNVTTEPSLQPMSGETFKLKSANREDGARLNVAATNFWERNGQRSFFNITVSLYQVMYIMHNIMIFFPFITQMLEYVFKLRMKIKLFQ